MSRTPRPCAILASNSLLMRYTSSTPQATLAAATLSSHELRRISVAACVDPRTVRTYLLGGRTTMASRLCIERALKELGLEQHGGDSAPPEHDRAA